LGAPHFEGPLAAFQAGSGQPGRSFPQLFFVKPHHDKPKKVATKTPGQEAEPLAIFIFGSFQPGDKNFFPHRSLNDRLQYQESNGQARKIKCGLQK
jgi:hypothetical protein